MTTLAAMRQHRHMIAEFIKGGASIAQATNRFKCTPAHVYDCLHEFDVPAPKRGTNAIYRTIGMMQDGTPPPEIAGRLAVSTAYVYAVRKRCLENGVRLESNP
jgi:hypothetical protein